MVFLSVAAVAVSCALLIIVASLFSGFIKAFEQSAVETIGDVVLAPPIKFEQYDLLIERLEKTSAVKSAAAIISTQGLLHLGNANVRAVSIWGISPDKQAKVTSLKTNLIRQKERAGEPFFEIGNSSEITAGFVGIGVVAEPDEETDEYDFKAAEKFIGQKVVLTTGTQIETKSGEEKKFKRKTIQFVISDIVFTGVYDIDKSFIYLPIEKLQKTLYPNENMPVAEQIQIKFDDGVDTDCGLAQIRGVWETFAAEKLNWNSNFIEQTNITTARQMQSEYVAELRKQMGVLLLIFGLVSFSVVVLIFCIFYMIVMTCQKDIAIVKSCGASKSLVVSVFAGFGVCVGLVGGGFGVGLGYVITKNISTVEEWIRIIFGLKLWKSSVYMFNKIPNQVDWNSVLPIVLSAVAAAAIGALIPAIIAAKTKPVNILRYE
ncbi:MAG: FtsX-like permease family protein [Planctomycetes bacterium]|nr:FtsX-like permease family protein [Planctomycetota bacterium]